VAVGREGKAATRLLNAPPMIQVQIRHHFEPGSLLARARHRVGILPTQSLPVGFKKPTDGLLFAADRPR
jgi:hypothetical protein